MSFEARTLIGTTKEGNVALRAEEPSFQDRMKHIRSGARLNSRVKVAIEWIEGGEKHRAEGYTVDISPRGCLVIAPQGFTVGQRLKLINLINQSESDAVLIWRGHEGRTGWELGLELQNPPMQYWGVEF
jgi:PilZ domain-containing protein